MASVWIHLRGEQAPRKLCGGMSVERACNAMAAGAQDWISTKLGRDAKLAPQNGLEVILYFSDGKVAGSLFVEPLSPPSGPEPGSIKVSEVSQ